MDIDALCDRLGFSTSTAFLRAGDESFETAVDHGHVFRQAKQEPCNLRGVYTLGPNMNGKRNARIPFLYLCEAKDEAAAREVHRLVWNQDVVPLLLVASERSLKLCSGFEYEANIKPRANALETTAPFTSTGEIDELIYTCCAKSIDSGRTWRALGKHVKPQKRLDWRLLGNLQKLDMWLQNQGLAPKTAHSLIGKYVFLHYLRDRGLLDRKLDAWKVREAEVFGRDATASGLQRLSVALDDWLNGGVFPVTLGGSSAPAEHHIRRVAGTFAGDDVGDSSWQLHLDFQAYDFSYIPIETLSVIYEQFLHSNVLGGTSAGRKAGAFYTPIPVVNFMLGELEQHVPVERGKRILDPSCGSGAFLVQYYRRLIEREFPATSATRPSPVQLRSLLTDHVFGIDRDPDACGVAELSLLLTLLDYVKVSDLDRGGFKLPNLRDANIIHEDLFKPDSPKLDALRQKGFDVLVGNPPWKRLSLRTLDDADRDAWTWIQKKGGKPDTPVAGKQLAQAFVWKSSGFLKRDGEAALLMPAMSLFEAPSKAFRKTFCRRFALHGVANFANLAEVLFAGRARVPAAALFYRRIDESDPQARPETIEVFSPLVANQELTRPAQPGQREECWTITLNSSELREIPYTRVKTGASLPWKLAAWGSYADERLLRRVSRKNRSFRALEEEGLIFASQGLELRPHSATTNADEKLEPLPEVVDREELDVTALDSLRNIFSFPPDAIGIVEADRGYVRKGRSMPIAICRAPHVIVSAARNFAVYLDEFLVVPARQIGISSPSQNAEFLKALSLYLSSDFAFYHQFLTSPQLGVQRGRATLEALRNMPIALDNADLQLWGQLWSMLKDTPPRQLAEPGEPATAKTHASKQSWFIGNDLRLAGPTLQQLLIGRVNNLVYDALELSSRERALVHDLVRVRLALNDGKCGNVAMRSPEREELRTYATRLAEDLNAFVGSECGKVHQVKVFVSNGVAMASIQLVAAQSDAGDVEIVSGSTEIDLVVDDVARRQGERVRQWLFLQRNQRLYFDESIYILKPFHRFHWTERQAMLDATAIVAETLGGEVHQDEI